MRPPVAFGLWAANLAIWHIPSLYDAALTHPLLHDLEHACWVLTGLLVWTLLIDPGSHGRLTVGGRVALAAGMFATGQVLTDVLVFTFHPLYPAYGGAYGLSAHTDQQLAGVVMMVEQLRDARNARLPAAAPADASTSALSSPCERDRASSFEPVFIGLAIAAADVVRRGSHGKDPTATLAYRSFRRPGCS